MAISEDIRAEIAEQLPEPRVSARFYTFESAFEAIETAAYNRRMRTGDFVGRAALAFAVFDSDGDLTWAEATEKEPPMRDLLKLGFDRDRLRGGGHGKWQIARLR